MGLRNSYPCWAQASYCPYSGKLFQIQFCFQYIVDFRPLFFV